MYNTSMHPFKKCTPLVTEMHVRGPTVIIIYQFLISDLFPTSYFVIGIAAIFLRLYKPNYAMVVSIGQSFNTCLWF